MKNSSKYKNQLNVVGKIIRDKRNEKNISFEKLSNKLLLLGINIPITSLYRIENNQRTVRDYELCAISIALDINPLDLITPFMKCLNDS